MAQDKQKDAIENESNYIHLPIADVYLALQDLLIIDVESAGDSM